jgi:hypothetical protein
MALGQLREPSWFTAHLFTAPFSFYCRALDVCDGAHWWFVMKKVKGPAQAKLGRGNLQSWEGREVWATRPGKISPLRGVTRGCDMQHR